MAPLFISLPPEIRLDIYRYLLYSPGEWITAHCSSYKSDCEGARKPLIRLQDLDSSFRFQPAILRCSHQTYTEAVAVLYGENLFVHSNWEYGNGPKGIGFALHNLSMIRYLQVHLHDDGNDRELQDFADATFVIRRAIGTLRTSSLMFSFMSGNDEHPLSRGDLLAEQVAWSAKVPNEIVALDVQQELKIFIEDFGHPEDMASNRRAFRSLVESVAKLKNWECVFTDGLYRSEPLQGSEDGEVEIECGWILRPTSNRLSSTARSFSRGVPPKI